MSEPTQQTDMIAARAAARQVSELGQLFRRAVDTYRTYRAKHQLTRAAIDQIHQKMEQVLGHGQLQLEVTLGGLMYDDKLIGASGKREDPLTAPLFGEGVRRLVFQPGLDGVELETFLDSWFDTVTQPKSSEGITTRFWEAELKLVQLVVIDSFAMGDESAADPNAAKQKLTARQQIDSLVSAISSQGLAGGEAEASRGSMLRVGADDIALLRAEGLRDITADSLKRQDTSHRPVATVSIAELAPLAAELGKVREHAAESLLQALVNAAVMGSEKDRDLLMQRVEAVVHALVEDGRFKEPLNIYQHLVELAKQDTELTQARTALLVKFKNALTTQWMLEKLVAAIDVEESNAEAFEVLQVARKAFEARLPAVVAGMKLPDAKQKIASLVTEAMSLADALPKVKTMGAQEFGDVLKRMGALKAAEQAQLVTEGLHSVDHGVHRLAVGALTPSLVPLLGRGVFAAQIGSPDAAVRQKALALALEMEDPSVAPALAQLLSLQRIGLDERRRIYAALAKLGNTKVSPALVDELDRQSDVDAKCEVARALGQIGDGQAATALEAVAGKLLTPGKLKQACKVAAGMIKIKGRGT